MALKATIFKIELQLSDLDRHYYQTHALTLARHPSETDERMMVRVIAFALHAHEALEFGKGLSSDDEPDLWRRDLTGAIEQWIEVGLPDEKRLRKASGRAAEVIVLNYGGRTADIWWEQNQSALRKLNKLRVINLAADQTAALAALAEQRTLSLNAMIQDGEMHLSVGDQGVHLVPEQRL
ncbi:MAG: YaeQ family protein [Betaproteobacteria bacterium]|nr:YaeQ family protein [Betaproteobacteria bacterium]